MTFEIQTVSSDRIQDTLYAFTRSQILFSALDLEVFTCIAQGADTLDTLMGRLHVSERGLRILLNGLVGIGFLHRTHDGAYRLPTDVARYLVRDRDDYIGGMVHHCKRLYENWEFLTDAVRDGQPAGGAQSLAQMETYFAELVKGLYVSNYLAARKLADRLEIGDAVTGAHILDVAGGSGVWSIAMLEKDPDSRVTLLDFESVIHVAEEYVSHHDLQDRYEYWPADLEEADFPQAAYDIAVMANICHALGPVSTRNVLNNLAPAIRPGGKLAIVDFVPDDARSKPGWPLIFGVNMLITTPEGDVFTEAEYRHWLSEAGFRSVTLEELEPDVTAIIAEK